MEKLKAVDKDVTKNQAQDGGKDRRVEVILQVDDETKGKTCAQKPLEGEEEGRARAQMRETRDVKRIWCTESERETVKSNGNSGKVIEVALQ